MVNANYDGDFAVFYGLSTDEKPTGSGIANGSCFVEMDDGKIYFYDADGAAGSEWIEWGAGA